MLVDYLATAGPAAIDHISVLAQSIPGEGSTPEAPPGFDAIGTRLVSIAKWVGLLIAIIGGIATTVGVMIARNQGAGEEATGTIVKFGIGISVIMGIVGLVSWLIEASGAAG